MKIKLKKYPLDNVVLKNITNLNEWLNIIHYETNKSIKNNDTNNEPMCKKCTIKKC